MVHRTHWISAIERLWEEKSVVWLRGVRRAGKTFLCQSLPNVEYFDCELPSARRELSDPERFLHNVRGRRVVLDEIHRLPDPSELLKIAADYHPTTRIVATGSSSLGASHRFRDTLTDRKRDLWLTPMLLQDEREFGQRGLDHRFRYGGLPPFYLSDSPPEHGFQEWIDSFWARDIQEHFRLRQRSSFLRFLELLFAVSGGIYEATRFATQCEISRNLVREYLQVLEETMVVTVVRPLSTRRTTEVVAAPKVYGFDTGFVSHFKGWARLHAEDRGLLWEHYVLNEYLGRTGSRRVFYWRDRRGHETDFVFATQNRPPVAVECKWRAEGFNPRNTLAFRTQYPEGPNYVVTADPGRSDVRDYNGVNVRFVGLAELLPSITADPYAGFA
ncbi:MAG: ATP-binding protein [Spirochaetaceae bacterium]|nr:ATP-binding protein [Spirochaetaceae bacterium]